MEELQNIKVPLPQKDFLYRWNFFFTWLLLFPLLLQLIFGLFSFTGAQWSNWLATLLFRGIAGTLFILLLPRIPRKAACALMIAGSIGAGIFNLLDIFLLLHFGTTFDYGIWQLIRIAPWHEAKGFFQLFLLRFTTLAILLLYPAAGIIIFTVKKNKTLLTLLLLFTGAVLFFFNSVIPPKKLHIATPAENLKSFLRSWQSVQLHQELEKASSSLIVSNDDSEALYVLVIGESHSRRRSSFYGFSKNTTPELKKMVQQKQIFRFDDAVTPHTMTIFALPELLTLYRGEKKHFSHFPSLPDIFRKAGFKVWYICNQTPDSEKELPFLAAAKRSDHFISLTRSKQEPDGKIIDIFSKILQSPYAKKLIIIQLLGNHWEYSSTYPKGEGVFKSSAQASHREKIINEYDNSLHYLDKNLARLISLLEKQNKNSFFLYLADHGESLYEEDNFAGHSDLFPTAATAEIPMFLWLSPHFARPELKKAAARAAKIPFLSSDLPHLLMELAGVKANCFQPERSLLNPAYKKTLRRVSTRSVEYETMKNRSTPVSEQ